MYLTKYCENMEHFIMFNKNKNISNNRTIPNWYLFNNFEVKIKY